MTPDAALFADNPPNGVGGSVALEIGATASGRNLISAAANTDQFPEQQSRRTRRPDSRSGPAADTGVEANVATNEVFAALGSTYFTTGGDKEAFRVHTRASDDRRLDHDPDPVG